jgi:hypothetical protein
MEKFHCQTATVIIDEQLACILTATATAKCLVHARCHTPARGGCHKQLLARPEASPHHLKSPSRLPHTCSSSLILSVPNSPSPLHLTPIHLAVRSDSPLRTS